MLRFLFRQPCIQPHGLHFFYESLNHPPSSFLLRAGEYGTTGCEAI
jgi:hypothetical protein